MRLHHKLMVLLVLFGLVPVLLVGWTGRQAISDLGQELAARGRETVAARVTGRLGEAVARAATLLDQRRAIVDLALAVQAAAAEKSLASGTPLAELEPAFADLADTAPEMIAAQFLVLERGERVSFAPYEDWPEGYDPRQERWYALAREEGRTVWTAPAAHPVSGELVLTAARPLYGAGGRFLGVTGIDVSVLRMVAQVESETELPPDATVMLIETGDDEDLRVVVRAEAGERADPDSSAAAWARPTGGGVLTAADVGGSVMDALLPAVAEGRSGLFRAPYRGTPSLWVYGGLGDLGVSLVAVVPESRIAQMSGALGVIVQDATLRQMAAAATVGLGIMALAVIGGWIGARTVSRPLRGLQKAMEKVAEGDLDARAPVRSSDEIGDLARGFNAMVPLLEDRLSLRHSLLLARDVQQALLPAEAPEVAGWGIAGVSVYSDGTGGDYYDFVPLRMGRDGKPRRLAVMVGDVSGHGVAAALLMTTTRALLRAKAEGADEPSVLLQAVNPLLAADVRGGRFMTLFCLFLAGGQHLISWSSAGHDPALLYDPQSDTFTDLDGEDIPLGVDGTWSFAPSDDRMLVPGQILVMGTDGLWETRNAAGTMYGKERLKEVIRSQHDSDASELCRAVLDSVQAHRGAAPRRDDQTVVVVKAR